MIRATLAFAAGVLAVIAIHPMGTLLMAESHRLAIGGCAEYLMEGGGHFSSMAPVVGIAACAFYLAAFWIAFASTFTRNPETRFRVTFWAGLGLLALVLVCDCHDYWTRGYRRHIGGLGDWQDHWVVLRDWPVPLIYNWTVCFALLVLIAAVLVFEPRCVSKRSFGTRRVDGRDLPPEHLSSGEVSISNNRPPSDAVDVACTENELIVTLADGRRVAVPLAWSSRLLRATPAQRANWSLIGRGAGIHWPDLDEDISVRSLLAPLKAGKLCSRNEA